MYHAGKYPGQSPRFRGAAGGRNCHQQGVRFSRFFVPVLVVVALAAAAWIGAVAWSDARRALPIRSNARPAAAPARSIALEYVPTAIGAPVSEFVRPLTTFVRLADLDADGLLDVVYCEGQKNTVRWIRQAPRGVFTERIIGEPVPGPVTAEPFDLNGDGRLDLLVASMGQITPVNDRVGSVVVLENLGDGQFRNHVLVKGVARVTDVRAADFDNDGRADLVVGQFGYDQGEIRWMRNRGNWQFDSEQLLALSGTIHTPVADFDGDGRTDFAALVSQEWEEVHLFRNASPGKFQPRVVWGSTNEDYGSSGLAVADLNRDGRPDLLYTNGDGFDYAGAGYRAWHGVQWLENQGEGRFRFHRIGDMPGAYSPVAADLDGDGALDLLTVSCFADWTDPEAVSMMAWINDGQQRFTPVVLARKPTHLVSADVGDLDGTGVPVIVTAGWHLFPPYDHLSNITVWRRR